MSNADNVVELESASTRRVRGTDKGVSMKQLDLLNVMHAATKIVSARVMTLVAMAMTFGLFCWAMWLGNNLSVITAAGFGLLVFLPVLAADRAKGGTQDE